VPGVACCRYLYIPLGASWRLLNVWVIFTFVALWHDLEIKLLGWAWLMALFISPEMLVKWVGSQPWCIPNKQGRMFRYAACAAAALNMLLLIAANMVGFVFGAGWHPALPAAGAGAAALPAAGAAGAVQRGAADVCAAGLRGWQGTAAAGAAQQVLGYCCALLWETARAGLCM